MIAPAVPWREEITALEWRDEDPKAARCGCCGGPPSLWEVDREGTVTKMVNCDRAELRPGDTDAPFTESCPMYSPSLAFNKATRRAAIDYWNMVQQRLAALREGSIVAEGERDATAARPEGQEPGGEADAPRSEAGRAQEQGTESGRHTAPEA